MSVQNRFVMNGPQVTSRRHSRAQINFFSIIKEPTDRETHPKILVARS